MRFSKDILHYAKIIGVLLVVIMIWMTSDRSNDQHRYPNGQPKSTINFIDGKAEGTCVWWYENGMKMTEGIFVNGKRHGMWTTWFINGVKKSLANYKDDRLHGTYTSWYRNGKLKHLGNYEADKLEGLQYYYDTAGILKEEKLFIEGEVINKVIK